MNTATGEVGGDGVSRSAALESSSTPPLDVLFRVLANERRRWVCRYLERGPDDADLGDLAVFIAAIENDVPERMVSSAERKRVYISLYQCHLPKMDDVGAVRFDPDRKSIRAGAEMELFCECLALVENHLRGTGDG